MDLKYNVTGNDRKKLVHAIAEILECTAVYSGAPSFSYEVGFVTIDKNGTASFDDRSDSEIVEQLIERLYEAGFKAENAKLDETRICISIPRTLFTNESLNNLDRILAVKGTLIKKAIGIGELPIFKGEDNIDFPCFSGDCSSEEIQAYGKLVCALCDMAKNQKRINLTDHPVKNERYAFRCFLLRLGFIGDEYKTDRKILLSKLEGSSAFKSQKEVSGDE